MLSISCDQNNPIRVLKWKVREGSTVSIGKVIFLYFDETDCDGIQHKFKSPKAGILKKIVAPEGAIVETGELLYWLKLCNHPTIMNDMCAECGADLRNEDGEAVASVPMIHAIPDLKVSEEQAQVIGKADCDRLLRDRKLVLLVDLDQTLIHTTNDNVPANIKDVYHFQLYGPHSPWYHTRLRPGTHKFLENIFPLFELHICTFGTRNYAHMIATFLDRDQKYFSNRILSRDECFDPTSKKANLKALFPCGDNLVCIIDDREDVWSNASNLIHVKPYHFFRHTGDINAPPGLDKQENDEMSGVDLSNLKAKKNGNRVSNGLGDKTLGTEEVAEQGGTNDLQKDQSDQSKHKTFESTSPSANGNSENLMTRKLTSCDDSKEINEEVERSSQDARETSEDLEQLLETNEKIEESSVLIKEIDPDNKEVSEKQENCPNELENISVNSQNQMITDKKCTDINKVSEEIKGQNDNCQNVTHEEDCQVLKINKKIKNISEVPEEEKENSPNESKEIIEISQDKSMEIDENIDSTAEIAEQRENSQNETKEIFENSEINDAEIERQCVSKDKIDKDSLKENGGKECKKNKDLSGKEKDLIEIEDPDGYLLDLECILKQIHKEFYERYDVMESGQVPDLKEVIPLVKSQVLKGTKIYFSGLVPTHQKLEQSKPYLIARSLGAKVTQDLEDDSTHLVAIRPGTAKVNSGKRKKNLKIVTPDWLWCCAERWEHVDERVFPLNNKGSKNRHPPPHCSSPTHVPEYLKPGTPTLRKRTPSGRFMDTINPLMSFSSDDIADMDKEVEDILDDESESSEEEEQTKTEVPELPQEEESSSSSSSVESLDTEFPRGYKRSFSQMDMAENDEEQNNSDDDEWPSTKFRRGEAIEGIEEWESQDSQNSFDAPDEITDGEWNMMGAALEREFLSNE